MFNLPTKHLQYKPRPSQPTTYLTDLPPQTHSPSQSPIAMSTTTTTTATAPRPPPPLPAPFTTTRTPMTLITRGAEALLYRTTFLSPTTPAALKIRPPKPWRHATLERRLTRARLLAEARVLVKLRRDGVPVPAVLALDAEAGWTCCEWIEGVTVKEAVRGRRRGMGAGEVEGEGRLRALMGRIGAAVGRLHAAGVVHGDLTTSNMIVRPRGAEEREAPGGLEGEIVLIDFGLASQGVQDEDKAVDLYVLERAFASTHPKEEGMFGDLLAEYGKSHKAAKAVLKRLEDVRMRGRKKSMIG